MAALALLLQCVLQDGRVVSPRPDLEAARSRPTSEVARLAEPCKGRRDGASDPVPCSQALAMLPPPGESALRQQAVCVESPA
ncbi:MAG: hypothetical protein AB7N91_01920 [Candidatus Tectimicrobiota bacterium]